MQLDRYSTTILIKVNFILGIVYFNISYGGTDERSDVSCWVHLVDADGKTVATTSKEGIEPSGYIGKLEVPDAKLWWPYLMNPNPGYLYSLEVDFWHEYYVFI